MTGAHEPVGEHESVGERGLAGDGDATGARDLEGAQDLEGARGTTAERDAEAGGGIKRWTGAKTGVIAITVLTLIYLVGVLQLAWGLITSGALVGVVMGIVLIVFPLIGAVVVLRDLRFVMRGDALLERLARAGELPEDTLPRRPSGRYVVEAADADFEQWKRGVEAAPEDAGAWARLALAYKASGDSARARAAMRQALRLDAAASA